MHSTDCATLALSLVCVQSTCATVVLELALFSLRRVEDVPGERHSSRPSRHTPSSSVAPSAARNFDFVGVFVCSWKDQRLDDWGARRKCEPTTQRNEKNLWRGPTTTPSHPRLCTHRPTLLQSAEGRPSCISSVIAVVWFTQRQTVGERHRPFSPCAFLQPHSQRPPNGVVRVHPFTKRARNSEHVREVCVFSLFRRLVSATVSLT